MADAGGSYVPLFWTTPRTVDGGQLYAINGTVPGGSLLGHVTSTVDGGQLYAVNATDYVDVGTYDSDAPGYAEGYAAGYAAALATLPMTTPPTPVPVPVTFGDPEYVDHVADGLALLMQQWRGD